MMIFLLEECNNKCPHCVRTDEPMPAGYKLSSEQLEICLEDCKKLKSVEWVHFSGGEPTLWREDGFGLVDLMITIADAGFDPGFTTNGIIFQDYRECENFFRKYIKNSNRVLRLYLSIDTFHSNFDAVKGRAASLDNILKLVEALIPEEKEKINLIVMAVISKDVKSLLPNEMIRHYESLGVDFRFLPLKSMGKAMEFIDLCPDLSSGKPEDLGAYHKYYKKELAESRDTDNIILIGNDYYFHNPQFRKIARLGDLPENIIEKYRS